MPPSKPDTKVGHMTVTTNYSWNLPTVNGDQDTWGTKLNSNWTALDTLLGGVSAAELGYLSGVTSGVQAQIDAKAPVASPTFTGTVTIPTAAVTTANVTTVDLGNWTITESAGALYFATGGVNKMKIDASGDLTVTGNVTAYGTV